MSEPMSARHSRPAQAAPAAQAQNLCKLVPPGYNPKWTSDQDMSCQVVYNEPDGSTVSLTLFRWFSPTEAWEGMPCDPHKCELGETCNSLLCSPVAAGDPGPDPDLLYAFNGWAHSAVRRRGRSTGARPAVAAPPVQATAQPRGRALLVVLQGSAGRPSLALTGSEVILRRDRSCALVLMVRIRIPSGTFAVASAIASRSRRRSGLPPYRHSAN